MKKCLGVIVSPCARRVILSALMSILIALAFATMNADEQMAEPGDPSYYGQRAPNDSLYFVKVVTGEEE